MRNVCHTACCQLSSYSKSRLHTLTHVPLMYRALLSPFHVKYFAVLAACWQSFWRKASCIPYILFGKWKSLYSRIPIAIVIDFRFTKLFNRAIWREECGCMSVDYFVWLCIRMFRCACDRYHDLMHISRLRESSFWMNKQFIDAHNGIITLTK